MRFETFRWLFPVAITVHNLEEAIWIPGWSQNVGKWHPPVGRYEFWFAVGVLTVLAYVLMALSIRHAPPFEDPPFFLSSMTRLWYFENENLRPIRRAIYGQSLQKFRLNFLSS